MLLRFPSILFACALRVLLIATSCASIAQAQQEQQPGLFESLGKLLQPQKQAPAVETITHERALAAAGKEHRVALVIGNAAYTQGALVNPVNDARAIANQLRSLGFEVVLRENIKARDIGGVYREFRSKVTPGGVALVFYAGHGVQFKGQNYFPAIDADIHSEEDVPLQSLNLGNLLDNMEEAKAGVSLVFLDACRDNPFARRFRSGTRGLAKVEAASGMLIHYATRPGSVASDGEGKNGTYTEALLAQMSQPGVPVEQMLKRVANQVVAKTKGKQEPWVEGSLRGDFYFIFQGPTTVQVQAPAADPEAETWAAAENDKTVEGYQAYLDAYPQGRYAVAARIKLRGLQKSATPVAVPPAPTSAPGAALLAPDDSETSIWNEVKSGGTREYLDAYLKQYPKGKYAALAKIELKKLDDAQRSDTSASFDGSGGLAADYWIKVADAKNGTHTTFLDTASITPTGDTQFGAWSRTVYSEPQQDGLFSRSYVTELRRKITNCNGPSMAHAELVRLDSNSAIVKKETWSEMQWRFDSLPSGTIDHAFAQSVCLLARLPFSKITPDEGSGDWRQIVQGIDNSRYDWKSLRGKEGKYVVRTRSIVDDGNTPSGRPFNKLLNNWLVLCKSNEIALYAGFFKNRLNQIADSYIEGAGALKFESNPKPGSLADEVLRIACRRGDSR